MRPIPLLLSLLCGCEATTTEPAAPAATELGGQSSNLISATRTIEVARNKPLLVPIAGSMLVPVYTEQLTFADEQALHDGLSARAELFPEVHTSVAFEGNHPDVDYSPTSCNYTDDDSLEALRTVPIEDVAPLLGRAKPDCGNLCGFDVTDGYHANTLHVGRTLNVSDSVLRDTYELPSGLERYKVESVASGDGHIVAARELNFEGHYHLEASVTHIFMASEAIKIAPGTRFFTEQGGLKGHYPDALRSKRDNVGYIKHLYAGDVVTAQSPSSPSGWDGPTVILIAPRVELPESGEVFQLHGTNGARGVNLPNLDCWTSCTTDTPCYHGPSYLYDSHCYDGGVPGVAGAGGNGGAGGNLLLVTNGITASHLRRVASLRGGTGGAGGDVGRTRMVTRNSSLTYGDLPHKSYGTAGKDGVPGASGSLTVAHLGQIFPELHYMLAGRAARRDMARARELSLDMDPDTDPSGRNRQRAIELYEGVLEEFCDDDDPSRSFSTTLVRPAMREERVLQCTTAAERLVPLRQGLNVFGLAHDVAVYLDPEFIQERRDTLIDRFEWEVARPFEQALASGAATTSNRILDALAARAADEAVEFDTAEQVDLLDLEHAEQEANTALARAERAQAALDERQAFIFERNQSMDEHLESASQSSPSLFGTFTKILSTAASVAASVYTGFATISTTVKSMRSLVGEGKDLVGMALDSHLVNGTLSLDTEALAKHPETEWKLDSFKNYSGEISDIKSQFKKTKGAFDKFWSNANAIPDNINAVVSGYKELINVAPGQRTEDFEAFATSRSMAERARVICGTQGAAQAQALQQAVLVRNRVASLPKSKHAANALADAEVILELQRTNDALAAQTCSFFEEALLARKRFEAAKLRRQLAQMRKENAARRANWLEDAVSEQLERSRTSTRALCLEAHQWEEQILMLDFLAARAAEFNVLEEVNPTESAMGNFARSLLDKAERRHLANEQYLADWNLRNWSAEPETLHHRYAQDDPQCDPTQHESERDSDARCASQRSVLGGLLDTGYIQFRLEDGPSRFGTLSTDLTRGRVTSVDAWLEADGSLTDDEQRLLDQALPKIRVSHGAAATFPDVDAAGERTWLHRTFDLDASYTVCRALQRAVRRFVGRDDASLECESIGRHFTNEPGSWTFDREDNAQFPEAQWALFGTSARGQWTVDARNVFRTLNQQDFCYRGFEDAFETGVLSPRAEQCLGDAFLLPECTEGADTDCDADGLDRVAAYMVSCSEYMDDADSPDSPALRGPAPPECDRACGPTCQAVKRAIRAFNFDVTVRAWGQNQRS